MSAGEREPSRKTSQRRAAEVSVAGLAWKADHHLAKYGSGDGLAGRLALTLGVYLPLVMAREPTPEDRDALAGFAARMGMHMIALTEGSESVAAYEKWAEANFVQGDDSP